MPEWSIGADGSPIWVEKGPEKGVEIDDLVPKIDQNASEMASPDGPGGRDSSRIVLRVDPGYHGWVQGLAERLGLNVTQTVAQGLLRLAEASGYCYSMPTRYTPKNSARRRRYPRPGESS